MPLSRSARAPLPAPLAGQYIFLGSNASGGGTSVTLGIGTLRLTPRIIESTARFDRLGSEITLVGDAGSKLRIGVYADDGTGYPGALVLDAGTIAGDSATVQEITLGSTLVLPPGIYWFGGAVQIVTTTQPTVRVTTQEPPFPMQGGSSAPAAGAQYVGNSQSSVTAALPGTFSTTHGGIGNAPRIHARAA